MRRQGLNCVWMSVLLLWPIPQAIAQEIGRRNTAARQDVTNVVAVAGEPFGVARIELPLSFSEFLLPDGEVQVEDAEGRVLYSASRPILQPGEAPPKSGDVNDPRSRRIGGGRLLARLESAIRNLSAAPNQRAAGREILFLFQGDDPLTVQLTGATSTSVTLRPKRDPQQWRSSLESWWSAYTNATNERLEKSKYPPIVETYLLTTLSRRLELPLPDTLSFPDATTETVDEDENQLAATLELIAGTEKLKTAILQSAAVTADLEQSAANLELPASPDWNDVPPAVVEEDIEIETTARHVPPECFYLRFGSFANYLWFRDLSQMYGGDISQMFRLRGIRNGGTKRIEDQLAVKLTELSRMLGATVIEDQAIIGTDLFLAEGASLGVLIQARNRFLLETSLRTDRAATQNAVSGATLEDETIAGRTVSFLSTPDNRLRSFLALEGNTIFVTNSRTLVERFYAVADGGQSLAQTAEFQLARQLMPLDREDTLFAYFSPAMLRNLVEPAYQIERRRRLFSQAEMALLRVARLAAAAEGHDYQSIETLVDNGYLPRGFGQRADGSTLVVDGQTVRDSMRGGEGTFLPIADAAPTTVTQIESDWYKRSADYFSENWRQIDPIMVGIQRSKVEAADSAGDWERLQIHAEIAPFKPGKYGWVAKQLGPPTTTAIQFAEDDIVAGHAHVVSNRLGGMIPPHYLFAAIKDAELPEPEQWKGIVRSYLALRSVPGYLGAWPQPGLLDRLPWGLGQGTPVSPGIHRLLGGLYRYQDGGFSVLSFQQDILTQTLPELAAVQTDNDAQVRLHVGNLVDSKLENWVNDQLYQQAAKMSQAGAAFLKRVTYELKLPPDAAQQAASELLGGELVCPLGGEYQWAETDRGQQWVSTAWNQDTAAPPEHAPETYTSPVLTWFRGLSAQLAQYDDRLVVDATVDTQHVEPSTDTAAKSSQESAKPKPKPKRA